jgi:MFS family permease
VSRPTNANLRGLLFVLSGNMLLDAVEVAKAVVALPSIGRDLELALPVLHWVVSGFAIGFGATLLFAGRIVEAFGRRRCYLVAVAVFAGAAAVSALSTDGPVLILTRFVQGACAALTAPTGLAIIAATFPPGQRRERALSVYALFGASGFAIGLAASGVLTGWSWRWAFAAPAPVALALLVAAVRLVPVDRPDATVRGVRDGWGAAGLFAATVAGVYGLGQLAASGWTDPRATGSLLLAGFLAVAWVHHERRSRNPLLDLRLLGNGSLVRAMGVAAAMNGSYWGFLVVVTLRSQVAAGWSPLRTALTMLPASVLPALTVPFARRLIGRYGTGRLIVAGSAAATSGYGGYLVFGGSAGDVAALGFALVLVGVGFALGFAALHVQAMSAVPPSRQAMGAGAYQTAVQLGGAVSLATVCAVLVVEARDGLSSVLAQPRAALAVCTAIAAIGLVIAFTGVLSRAPSGSLRLPAERPDAMSR